MVGSSRHLDRDAIASDEKRRVRARQLVRGSAGQARRSFKAGRRHTDAVRAALIDDAQALRHSLDAGMKARDERLSELHVIVRVPTKGDREV
jgi:hypothetical protein